jgi:hypothetical protein
MSAPSGRGDSVLTGSLEGYYSMETQFTAEVAVPEPVVKTMDEARTAATGGNVFSQFVIFRDPLPGGATLTLPVTGIPD